MRVPPRWQRHPYTRDSSGALATPCTPSSAAAFTGPEGAISVPTFLAYPEGLVKQPKAVQLLRGVPELELDMALVGAGCLHGVLNF